MRICLISEYFYPDNTGGTGTVLSHLARHLQDNYEDVQLHVITSKNLYRGEMSHLPAYENWNGIQISRLKTPKSNRASTALRLLAGLAFTIAVLRKLMFQRRYDVIFIVTNPPTLPMAVQVFSRLRHTPYVYLIHDLYPDVATALGVLSPTSLVANLLRRLQWGWLHSAGRIVVLGRCMRDYLLQHYQLSPERIEVITNWSDADTIRPAPKETQFRAKHALTGFVVLYAGNFGQYQSFDCILDAAKRLQDGPQDISFVFVGDGAQKEYIMGRVATEKLQNVKLLPFVPQEEFADLLGSADVSLVTLEPGAEGLGVPSKFYNILASGRPTVALVSPESEVAQVIAEAGCGVTVPQGDEAALAETIEHFVNNPGETQRMGENARQVFEKKYTLPQVAAQFHELFSKICAQR